MGPGFWKALCRSTDQVSHRGPGPMQREGGPVSRARQPRGISGPLGPRLAPPPASPAPRRPRRNLPALVWPSSRPGRPAAAKASTTRVTKVGGCRPRVRTREHWRQSQGSPQTARRPPKEERASLPWGGGCVMMSLQRGRWRLRQTRPRQASTLAPQGQAMLGAGTSDSMQ